MSSFPKSTSQQIVDKYFVIVKDYFEALKLSSSIQNKQNCHVISCLSV